MSGAAPDQIADALRVVRSSAFNINIFPGIAVIYLKACLLAALTLFVSTFATSNIFTIVVMAFIYFIGHLQATAREVLAAGTRWRSDYSCFSRDSDAVISRLAGI